MELKFQYPEFFWLFAAIPLFVFLFILVLLWKKRITKSMGDEKLIKALIKNYSPRLFALKFILSTLAFIMGVFALANLRSPELSENINRKGIDVVIALDVSKSMLATDIPPNRLERAKHLSDKVVLESGLRGDCVNEYGLELLPRVSAMFRITPKLTMRVGGSFGYKAPTIFTEDAERRQFQNLLPIDIINSRNERSVGGNWDINYKTNIGNVGFSVNHLFFYTMLKSPLVLVNAPTGKVQFQNSNGHIDTKGTETNLRFVYGDFKLFIGYTYTDANTHFTRAKEWLPLTARHRLNNVLMYEIEDKLKIGLEAYYFSRQKLNDESFGKSYWITGLMAEKLWEKFSLFVNFENFTNTRQSRFDTIYTGTNDNPVFRDIYAPVEGFVVNGGVKIML